jgi:hypothetical protein
VIGLIHRPLPDNTQHSEETDIHAHSRIQTHNPSKLVAADPNLRQHGNWDQRGQAYQAIFSINSLKISFLFVIEVKFVSFIMVFESTGHSIFEISLLSDQ